MWKKAFQLLSINYYLFHVWQQIVDIEDTQLQGTYHETGGIDTLGIGEELMYQLVLSLLQTLHAKGHSTQVGDLLLRIT